jgi:hypothetical protein
VPKCYVCENPIAPANKLETKCEDGKIVYCHEACAEGFNTHDYMMADGSPVAVANCAALRQELCQCLAILSVVAHAESMELPDLQRRITKWLDNGGAWV